MDNTQRGTNGNKFRHFQPSSEIFGQGCSTFPNNRLITLCLGLLNAVLLIAAVAIAINCAKVKEGSFQVSHSAAAQLITELDYLRSNHSDVIKAEEEAKNALERAIKNHEEMKVKIEQLKTINNGYQTQMKALITEKSKLQTNISRLEGSCGRCLSGWIHFNSSCYFFSYNKFPTVKSSWPDSRADCNSRSSDLVVIDNQEEQKFVTGNIGSLSSRNALWDDGFWIGLTDTDAEGTWMWINNVTVLEQRYWMDGEPNDYSNEDCAGVYPRRNVFKSWNDAPCETLLYWICETSLY